MRLWRALMRRPAGLYELHASWARFGRPATAHARRTNHVVSHASLATARLHDSISRYEWRPRGETAGSRWLSAGKQPHKPTNGGNEPRDRRRSGAQARESTERDPRATANRGGQAVLQLGTQRRARSHDVTAHAPWRTRPFRSMNFRSTRSRSPRASDFSRDAAARHQHRSAWFSWWIGGDVDSP